MRQICEFGDFRADPAEQLLLHRGQPVALALKIFETLLIRLKSEGRMIDNDEFIRGLWPEVFVEDTENPDAGAGQACDWDNASRERD